MKPAVGDILELNIDRLTYNGGRGLGRHSNFVIFVANTAPGDLISAEIIESKKNYAVAKLIKVIKHGPDRIEPLCIYYNECGGCQLQHITYSEQLKQKQSFIQRSIQNLKLDIKTYIKPAPNEFHYRNRIQLHNKNNQLGYYKKNSHTFIPISECIIAEKVINSEIKNIKASSERVEIAVTTEGNVITRNPKKSDSNNLFSQINSEVNKSLIKYVLAEAQKENYSHIYDAYCGQGNFTFPLLENFNNISITGIEYSSQNIKFANNKKTSINFVESSVENYFKKNRALNNSLVILDPPRAGCDKSLFRNIGLAKKIIYISCDLSTFERDARILLSSNFTLDSLVGFDMFPQTSHIEVCGVFNKIN